MKRRRQRTIDTPAIHPLTRKIIHVNYQRDARITDIDKDLRRLPGVLSWYLQLKDTAKTAVKEAQYQEHCVEEDLNLELRLQSKKKGEPRLTETDLRMRVKTDPRMRAAFRARMDAETILRGLESAVAALIEKKWALKAMVDLRRFEHNDDSA